MNANLAAERLFVMQAAVFQLEKFEGLLPQSPITQNSKTLFRDSILMMWRCTCSSGAPPLPKPAACAWAQQRTLSFSLQTPLVNHRELLATCDCLVKEEGIVW